MGVNSYQASATPQGGNLFNTRKSCKQEQNTLRLITYNLRLFFIICEEPPEDGQGLNSTEGTRQTLETNVFNVKILTPESYQAHIS